MYQAGSSIFLVELFGIVKTLKEEKRLYASEGKGED